MQADVLYMMINNVISLMMLHTIMQIAFTIYVIDVNCLIDVLACHCAGCIEDIDSYP